MVQLRRLWRFVGNPISGEDLENVFGASHHRGDIKAKVNCPGNKTLFLDVVAGKPYREDRTNDGNGLEQLLCDRPTTPLNNSFFWFRRHAYSVVTKV